MRIMMRCRPVCQCGLLLLLILSACGRAASTAPSSAGVVCVLGVEGRWIKAPSGQAAILAGANLPSLTEMENSSYKADARLRDLAAAGARIVRLAVDESELTPTFVPARVSPFIEEANQLGLLVVLSWRATIGQPVNDMVDDAEDWLRLEITYLSNHPGVWFDLYDGTKVEDVPALRQRNIAQRLVDVARGFRADNILVVGDPIWMLDGDPAVNQPLAGGNIVYGLDDAGLDRGYDIARYPFIVTRAGAGPQTMDRALSLSLGAIAKGNADALPQTIAAFTVPWKSHAFDWSACVNR